MCSRIPSLASIASCMPGLIGKIVGMCSWKRVSAARIATAGAVAVLARLPSLISGTSRCLPSSVRTNTMRSGWVLAAVGAHLASSQIPSSSASVTGVSAKLFAVRASLNSSLRAASSRRGRAEVVAVMAASFGSSASKIEVASLTLAPGRLNGMPGGREDDHAPLLCDAALTRAFQFLGKRWNGVLLASLTGGPLGFSQLRRAVTGISDSVLSERLGELAAAGLVERTVQPGPPVSVSYALTVNGHALTPALHELTAWAANNLPAERCAAQQRRATG